MTQKIIEVVGTSKESFGCGKRRCGSRENGSWHEVGTGSRNGNGTGRQEDKQLSHHNEDLLEIEK